MTKNVVTTSLEEPIESAARKMEQHMISALPVVDEEQRVIGIIGDEALNRFISGL